MHLILEHFLIPERKEILKNKIMGSMLKESEAKWKSAYWQMLEQHESTVLKQHCIWL